MHPVVAEQSPFEQRIGVCRGSVKGIMISNYTNSQCGHLVTRGGWCEQLMSQCVRMAAFVCVCICSYILFIFHLKSGSLCKQANKISGRKTIKVAVSRSENIKLRLPGCLSWLPAVSRILCKHIPCPCLCVGLHDFRPNEHSAREFTILCMRYWLCRRWPVDVCNTQCSGLIRPCYLRSVKRRNL